MLGFAILSWGEKQGQWASQCVTAMRRRDVSMGRPNMVKSCRYTWIGSRAVDIDLPGLVAAAFKESSAKPPSFGCARLNPLPLQMRICYI